MSAQTLVDPAVRAGIYKRQVRRNRIVGALRIVVPLIGLVLLGFLLVEIYIAKMADDFGVSGIRLDKDRLLIETPRYEGVMQNGTLYEIIAKTASALIAEPDIIELNDANLRVVRPDGVFFNVMAAHAFYDLVNQTVEVPDFADVVDSRKIKARLHNAFADWSKRIVTARSGAEITFADGTELLAQTLVMYNDDNRWDMTGVVLETHGVKEEP
jgi:lipopolysaccharide export system protein LptC